MLQGDIQLSEAAEVNCYITKVGDKYEIQPRNGFDKLGLESFIDKRGRFVTIRLMKKEAPKTMDQQRAFFSLAALHFRAFNGHAPSTQELKYWYYDLLVPQLFPVRQSSVEAGKFVPKTLSECSKLECVEIISKLLSLVAEAEGIDSDIELQCKDVFEWINQQRRELESSRTLDDELSTLEELSKEV